jgi:hypothetical protein
MLRAQSHSGADAVVGTIAVKRGLGWALGCGLAAIAAGATASTACAEAVSGGQLFGYQARVDWVRYLNARFGLRVDLPDKGFRRELTSNGSGMTLTSLDQAITIEVHANWVKSILPGETPGADRTIAFLHDQAVAQTWSRGGKVTYSVRHHDFYVISGTLGPMVYYERLAISPACPDVFDAIRVKYPQTIERELDPLVTRLSMSLRAICPAATERQRR